MSFGTGLVVFLDTKGKIMKKILSALLVLSLTAFWQGCSEDSSSTGPETKSSESKATDNTTASSSSVEEETDDGLPNYARAIEFNKKLGHGINFGNSWESGYNTNKSGAVLDYDDSYWSNPIQDEWFQMVKDAGFQSIRMPVRWNQTAQNEPPYLLQELRLEGVKKHVHMANALGMPVVINQHHDNELYEDPTGQLDKFYGIWEQIAEEFKDFPDDSLAFEILNESRGQSDKYLTELTKKAIEIIRKTNPTRTILVNPGNWGKFELMDAFADIKDSNMIIDGHYYEPYSYSHQGTDNSNPCRGPWNPNDQEALLKIVSDLRSYVTLSKKLFPGKNGTSIPLNIGEFGASAHCEAEGADEANRAQYIKAIIQTANQLGLSWHIWGLTGVGFDIYDKSAGEWYPTIIEVIKNNI